MMSNAEYFTESTRLLGLTMTEEEKISLSKHFEIACGIEMFSRYDGEDYEFLGKMRRVIMDADPDVVWLKDETELEVFKAMRAAQHIPGRWREWFTKPGIYFKYLDEPLDEFLNVEDCVKSYYIDNLDFYSKAVELLNHSTK